MVAIVVPITAIIPGPRMGPSPPELAIRLFTVGCCERDALKRDDRGASGGRDPVNLPAELPASEVLWRYRRNWVYLHGWLSRLGKV